MVEQNTAPDHLSVSDIDVYLGGRKILDSISFSATAGEVVVLVGANGAGKSTLLKSLVGLIEPKSGTACYNDGDIARLDTKQRAQHFAFLPQDRVVFWAMTVENVVALGRLPHRGFFAGPSEADIETVQTAMTRMGVMHLAQRPIATLSGGERARVLIARALAQQARFIVADEPTDGLDPAHALRVFMEFRALADAGSGVVTSLHDLTLAARFADKICLLKDGSCLAFGLPDDVLTKDHLRNAFGVETVCTKLEGLPVVVPTHPLTS